ncbi:MAG: hypothetical protein GF350_03520, partial [Chitinivibrionales bacterium]|nr:hypothetical protein [Chitinivibrionales bacterium]
MQKKITGNSVLQFIASLRLTVACLLILSILTFWGTLYQVENGLYLARIRFFGSWVLLIWNVIPFPGTKLVIAVLALNLVVSFFVRIKSSWEKCGILLVHAGVALLFIAAGFTHYFADESYLSLYEGEKSSYSSSYRSWELALYAASPDRESIDTVESIDFDSLSGGKRIVFPRTRI